ncbi:GGDEF domain-containing protein [Kineosporia succinea]|uniref:Diguanylate cyclase (GGDEF)-like protein n=1 Tax=Kineosporia succinea TaxID=84632 RepID=A0ABT9PED4_9ACTN|nr:GGDEF domain-containing protein [Kineosporia succinea]MDP9831057.1 diguanylate cyclase (GGDEF)-like protein [Kineosporia succinea]
MIPAQAAGDVSARQHDDALRRAYALIEASQDRDVSAEVETLAAQAHLIGWADVTLLLHFARSLAVRGAGLDDSEHVRAMLQAAEELGDPALLALALATTAHRAAVVRVAQAPDASGAEPLVRAAVLLDDTDSLVVHRIAAHLEVANAFHTLGLWGLAREQFALADPLFRSQRNGPWAEVVRRQRRVTQINGMDLALDEACALAEFGDWDAARELACRELPGTLRVLDADWPISWAATVHAFTDLFAALAGEPSPADRAFVASRADDPQTDSGLAMLAVADAFRAHHAGDHTRAAALAETVGSAIGPDVPVHVRLLALNLAAHASPPVALTYIRQLVDLRWNSRLSRTSSMRAAIEAERRRLEHELLRDQVYVDDLTGLGNRRAYSAYLERLRTTSIVRNRRRKRQDVVIMMIDVDHFKAVNDTFGHDAGDEVLRRIGGILAGHVRPSDLAARLGGDEFVVVMTQDADGVGAERAASILTAVEAHHWAEIGDGLRISISLGLHSGNPADVDRLLTEADRQLYEAKRGGRGRLAGGATARPGR